MNAPSPPSGAPSGTRAPEALRPGGTSPPAPAEARTTHGLTLLAWLAVLLAFPSVPTYGVGAALAVLLLVLARVRHNQGYRVRGVVIAGISALVISAASAFTWWVLLLRPTVLTGAAVGEHQEAAADFDKAFAEATKPPPPRPQTKAAEPGQNGHGMPKRASGGLRDAEAPTGDDGAQ